MRRKKEYDRVLDDVMARRDRFIFSGIDRVETTMASNGKAILATRDGFRLLSDRFIDSDGLEYRIRDIKQARMKEGNAWKGDVLLIEFTNGESKEFFFNSLPTPLWNRMKRAMIASFTMGGRGVLMTVTNDVQTQIADWAANINALIDSYNGKPK
jgi:hypothetical protein